MNSDVRKSQEINDLVQYLNGHSPESSPFYQALEQKPQQMDDQYYVYSSEYEINFDEHLNDLNLYVDSTAINQEMQGSIKNVNPPPKNMLKSVLQSTTLPSDIQPDLQHQPKLDRYTLLKQSLNQMSREPLSEKKYVQIRQEQNSAMCKLIKEEPQEAPCAVTPIIVQVAPKVVKDQTAPILLPLKPAINSPTQNETQARNVSNLILTSVPYSEIAAGNVGFLQNGQVQTLKFPNKNQSRRSKPSGKVDNHRRVEKEYRDRLNKKAEKLKKLIQGSNNKLTKGDVYTKSYDLISLLIGHIRKLQNENRTLKAQNENIVQSLKLSNISLNLIPNTMAGMDNLGTSNPNIDSISSAFDTLEDIPGDPEDLPELNTDTIMAYCDSPEESPSFDELSPEMDMTDIDLTSFLDKSRFMFMMLFSFFLFNPFRLLLHNHSISSNIRPIGGRTLQGASEEYGPSSVLLVMSWILTVVIAILILVKLLIFDEPCLDRKSKTYALYSKYKQQADESIKKNDISSAVQYLTLCLTHLHCPLPRSSIDTWASVLWQVFRQTLSCLRVKSILLGLVRRFSPTSHINRVETAHMATSCYHTLHEFYLSGLYDIDHVKGLNLCLASLNTAELAAKSLPAKVLAKLYLSSALHFRRGSLNLLRRYFISLAVRTVSQRLSPEASGLKWILKPKGYKFVLNFARTDVKSKHSWHYVCPVQEMSNCYFKYLMSHAVQLLLRIDTIGNVEKEVLDAATELQEFGEKGSVSDEDDDDFDDIFDPPSFWWSNVIRICQLWSRAKCNDKECEDLHEVIDSFPEELLSEPLAVANFNVYKARKIMLSEPVGNYDINILLDLLKVASKHVQDSLAKLSCRKDSYTDMAIALFALKWLLETRFTIWRQLKHEPRGKRGVYDTKFLSSASSAFQQDLLGLRRLAKQYDPAAQLDSNYEAMGLIMSGSNPLRTQQLLNKTLNKIPSTSSTPNGKTQDEVKANALLLCCEFLPREINQSPAELTNMITEAANIFECLGDQRSVERCEKVLSRATAIRSTVNLISSAS